MRIITGSMRGKKLRALDGRDVRPTADRVKEALFNILQFRVEGRSFLDLFAGSGQIGLEALSRGAASAVFVDSNRRSLSIIEENVDATKMRDRAKIMPTDFASYLSHTADSFDVAFLDPPFGEKLLEKALSLTADVMNLGGIIICEHPADEDVPEDAGEFVKRKSYKYGKIMLTSYEHKSLGEQEKE